MCIQDNVEGAGSVITLNAVTISWASGCGSELMFAGVGAALLLTHRLHSGCMKLHALLPHHSTPD